MVHGQHTVEFAEVAAAEKAVGGVRAEHMYFPGPGLLHGREDDFLLLIAHQAAVSGVGIQPQDGYAGFHDSEILGQRIVEEAYLLHQRLLGD